MKLRAYCAGAARDSLFCFFFFSTVLADSVVVYSFILIGLFCDVPGRTGMYQILYPSFCPLFFFNSILFSVAFLVSFSADVFACSAHIRSFIPYDSLCLSYSYRDKRERLNYLNTTLQKCSNAPTPPLT